MHQLTYPLKIILFVMACLLANTIMANQPQKIDHYDQQIHSTRGDWWLSWGVGAGVGNGISGMGSNWSFNYQLYKNQLVSARIGGLFETKKFGRIYPFYGYFTTPLLTKPRDGYIGDIGPMYGYMLRFGHALYTLSGGMGYVQWRGETRADGSRPKQQGTFGLPFESQLFWSYDRSKGIGAMVYGNLNTKNPYVVLALALHYGHIG